MAVMNQMMLLFVAVCKCIVNEYKPSDNIIKNHMKQNKPNTIFLS